MIVTTEFNYSFAFLSRLVIDFTVKAWVTTLFEIHVNCPTQPETETQRKTMLNMTAFCKTIDSCACDLGGGKLSIELARFVDTPRSRQVNNHAGRRHMPALCFAGEKASFAYLRKRLKHFSFTFCRKIERKLTSLHFVFSLPLLLETEWVLPGCLPCVLNAVGGRLARSQKSAWSLFW